MYVGEFPNNYLMIKKTNKSPYGLIMYGFFLNVVIVFYVQCYFKNRKGGGYPLRVSNIIKRQKHVHCFVQYFSSVFAQMETR